MLQTSAQAGDLGTKLAGKDCWQWIKTTGQYIDLLLDANSLYQSTDNRERNANLLIIGIDILLMITEVSIMIKIMIFITLSYTIIVLIYISKKHFQNLLTSHKALF